MARGVGTQVKYAHSVSISYGAEVSSEQGEKGNISQVTVGTEVKLLRQKLKFG